MILHPRHPVKRGGLRCIPLALGLVVLAVAARLEAATTADVAGGQAPYSFTTRLRRTVVATDAVKVWIRFPLTRTAGDQNFSQSAPWSMQYSTPPDEEEHYTDYWTIARWYFDPPADVTIWAEIRYTGSAIASFPSFADDNFTWYPDGANYMASTDQTQVDPTTRAAAEGIRHEALSYLPWGRMGDLEAIGSWAQQLTFDDDPLTPQDGASVIATKRGNCVGFAQAMCSLCKSMGIPAGIVTTVSFAGGSDVGCGTVSSRGLSLHAVTVAWDGVGAEWIVADPQYSGTCVAPAAVELALGPDVTYGEPAAGAEYEASGSVTYDLAILQNTRTGGSGATCLGQRETCGYSGCSGWVVARENLGPTTRVASLGVPGQAIPTVVRGVLEVPERQPAVFVFDMAGRLVGQCNPPCRLPLRTGFYGLRFSDGRTQRLVVLR